MKDFIDIINKDKEVKEFADSLTNDELEMNICLLLEQVRANKICNDCKGKKQCLSDVDKMQSYLIKNTSIVTREYYDCSYLNNVTSNGLDLLHFPKELNQGEFYLTNNRADIINAISNFVFFIYFLLRSLRAK